MTSGWQSSLAGATRDIIKLMARTIKEEAFRLVDRLPDSAGWDELMEQIWIRQSIEAGIADSDADRTTPVEQIREGYGLPE